MANTTIPNLPPAISLDGTELWELVQNGVSRRATTQQLVNLASTGSGTVTLINTAGALTGGPITGSGTISLPANAITNTYLAPMGPGTLKGNLTGSAADPQDVTVNAVLDSIGATPGSMLYRGAGAWALVPPGTSGQYLSTSGAVPQWGTLSVGPSDLTPTGVSAGTYGSASSIPQFTVLASGQLSAAGNVSIQISTSQVTGLGTMATQNATAVAITGGTMNGVVIGGGAPAAASFTNILAGTWLGTAVGVAYGGTGATTAPGARSNLGAAASGAVGSSGITMATARLLGRSTAGTGAIEEITIGTNLTLSGGVLNATGGGGGGSGTVTSIDVSGGTTGLTFSGGPVTTSGTITLAGTLAVANGGTGATAAPAARTNLGATTVGANLFTLTNPSAVTFPRFNADNTVSALDAATFRTAIGAGTGSGSVTSVAVSGGTTGLTTSGGPITGSGTITLAGTLAVANGGTGATAAPAARTNLGATTVGSNLFTLANPSAVTFPRFNADNTVSTLDASTFRTAIGAGTGNGTVTSVNVSGGTTGLTTSGGPVTGSGTITLGGTLAVANGGTGATDAATARSNLTAQKTITSGTATPTGGVSGDIYLQYT
jgi:hypothetical protein